MGIRFLVGVKQRAFSLPSLPSNLSPSARQHQSTSTSVRSLEGISQSAMSTQHLNLNEDEILNRYINRSLALPCAALQSMEKDSADVENTTMNTGIKFGRCLCNGIISDNNLEDVSIHRRSIRPSTNLQFNLLNENLDKIEHILADTDSVMLERDILIHMRRLGALKLFHACLSRTLMPLAEGRPNTLLTDHFIYCSKEWPIKQEIIVFPSGKKEERKLRRSRAKEKSSIVSSHLWNLKRISKPLDTLQSRSRYMIARNESKLSISVKDVANLERIRVKLEKETGEEVSHERWAEAAGIDLKALHQRLHVGWHSRDKLIRSTRPLVVFLARNYKGIGVALDDLLQAGGMGVLKGAERFDNSRGYRFSTYIQYWIRKSMLSIVTRYSRGIQLPPAMLNKIKRVQGASKIFQRREGRFPEDDEIADITNLSLATIRLARRCSKVAGSFDQWQTALMELTPDTSVETPFEFVLKQHKERDLLELFEILQPRERQVLMLRYGLHDGRSKSYGEIGSLCNVSKEWIRRIETAAMKKIKSSDILEKFNFY